MNATPTVRKACVAILSIVAWALCTLNATAQEQSVSTVGIDPFAETYALVLDNGQRLVLDAKPLMNIVAAEQDSVDQCFSFVWQSPEAIGGERLKKLIDNAILATNDFLELLHLQTLELEAYFRCHSKKDEGFKEVYTFAKRHKMHTKRVKAHLKRLLFAATAYDYNRDALRANLQKVPLYYGSRAMWDKCRVQPDDVIIFHAKAGGALCDNALTMKYLFTPIDAGATMSIDRRGNVFLYQDRELINQTAAYFGERFGKDGSYYQGYFNAADQREGNGFGVDTQLVKCGEWEKDAYVGQVLRHHPGRIYGIDISRYNHDMKGPVHITETIVTPEGNDSVVVRTVQKVKIGWDDLRITDLGPTSPKVEGEANYPVDFVFIKCSEGMDLLNAYYNADLDSCLAHGIRVAPYHFFSIKSKAIDQAANFIANGRIDEATMRPMFDVEPDPQQLQQLGGIDVCIREMTTFVTEVEKATGRKCVLYLNQNFVERYYDLFTDALRECDIWIAKYHQRHPWSKHCIWQFTSHGRVNGIYGEVDLNVFNGTSEDFIRWCEEE